MLNVLWMTWQLLPVRCLTEWPTPMLWSYKWVASVSGKPISLRSPGNSSQDERAAGGQLDRYRGRCSAVALPAVQRHLATTIGSKRIAFEFLVCLTVQEQ